MKRNNYRSRGGGTFDRGRRSSGRGRRSAFDPTHFIKQQATEKPDEDVDQYTAVNTFETFGLSDKLYAIIDSLGLKTPTEIQDKIIKEILDGKDVVGVAETGTGKTAAFLIPLIERSLNDTSSQVLILVPTRELALQVGNEIQRLTRGLGIYHSICVGGVDIRPQIKSLKKQNQFIVGTPGRVIDLMKRGFISGPDINTVVLDEFDCMLDMGFVMDMRKIIKKIPENRHMLLFSATFPKPLEGIANEFLKSPVKVSVKKSDASKNIKQDILRFKESEKFNELVNLISQDEFKKGIVFCAMKHSTKKLAEQLLDKNLPTDCIHGNKTHGQRQKALNSFKKGDVKVLVATDVATRGIHVDNVSHVVNYDLPSTFEDYIHRIGRTGRGDKLGTSVTFVPKR